MSKIVGTPNCPLCLKKFQVEAKGRLIIYKCGTCSIRINATDPMVDKWADKKQVEKDMQENIICPKCHSAMRFFSRSDGYMKSFCPVCKTTVETDEELPYLPGRHTT